MNYRETLEYIHSLGNFGLPAGLDRIKKVLNQLGNPQNEFKAIHIAGTNGKGSVTAFVSSVFKEAGYKTGTFISPYIIDFRERIQINGEYISEADLTRYAEIVKQTGVKLTEFEFITALAFLYFKEQKIDILVCETGLGGRFDATNTLENKVVTVITKIGMDHTAVLGDTIEKIAEEKCGIFRSCPTVTTPFQDKKALEVIKSKTANLIIPDISKLDGEGNTYIYKGKKFEISLLGDFQTENSLVAIETVKNSGFDIPYNTIYKGLKNTFFPARLEIISKKPLILLDGAHNPDGACVLAKELSKFKEKPTAIVGMMKDKNVREVLNEVLKHCASAVCVTVPNNPRSMSGEELSEIASEFCNCSVADSLEMAIEKTKEQNTVIFGSLYLASAIRPLLLEKN
ncbi:MAG: bifunctional folylpolyglutamate synthase/dihydrofolate synthase [Clostridia bacterium]|nr:bifunctional folylpolyglutamate synthase/dihydrofolate synthase [Clostridia bacterium]